MFTFYFVDAQNSQLYGTWEVSPSATGRKRTLGIQKIFFTDNCFLMFVDLMRQCSFLMFVDLMRQCIQSMIVYTLLA